MRILFSWMLGAYYLTSGAVAQAAGVEVKITENLSVGSGVDCLRMQCESTETDGDEAYLWYNVKYKF